MIEIKRFSAIFLISVSLASSKIHPIRDYQPKNDVSAYLALSEDLRAMDTALRTGTSEGFEQALHIYQNGAYSDPYAYVNVEGGLPFDIPQGTTLTGMSNSGKPTTVVVAFKSYKAGATAIEVAFLSDPPCRYSGDPVPELSGCLVTDGDLVLEGQPSKIPYSYTLDNIRNYHTIQNFSRNANGKFRPHGNAHTNYYKDFQQHVDFFGSPDFADQIIMSAFNRKKFVSPRMEIDFTKFDDSSFFRSVIIHTAAYLIIRLFVVRELDNAITECDHGCGVKDCNAASVYSLDSAVALYTGSVFMETGSGNLMYGLADKMCEEFRTCGSNGDSEKGESKINIDIFQEFNDMQKNLDSSHCLEAKVNKETIVKKMTVPILQAAILAAFLDAEKDSLDAPGERLVFTTTILPRVFHCDMSGVQSVIDLTSPLEDLSHDDFESLKEQLESKYRCMGVSCHDIGGIWDDVTQDYVEGAESCDKSQAAPVEEESSMFSKHTVIAVLVVFSILALLAYCLCKRCFSKKKNKNKHHGRPSYSDNRGEIDDSDSDSDDDSVEMQHRIT